MNTDYLKEQARQLRVMIQESQEEAELVISEYWAFFKIENKRVMQEHQRGDNERKLARLAPVIERGTDNRKPRLRWRMFDGVSRKITKSLKSNRVASKAITPRKRGYTAEQLERYCSGWEKEQVLKTESQLKLLRKSIDYLNDALRGIERTIRYANQGDSNE
ncbi:conjugative transfer protein MobI(A/C) [Aliidiomarina quisquiliarum]|uniref:conjugative transfer protein MobI(A/C) n=1 Tax=Aliidiomarina quisquiliarum TaxID=2938947 RepID=UPI00208F6CF1|nr:conjugative transfer protein MobI(A/C) [Aliidiomarina quisquiliarum]MCO4319915.1 hypothetical protein [Aliidiomarina quisquiliarum]